MDSTPLLLVLMGTVCGIPVCKHPCERTIVYNELSFKHISEFQDSSVAPWEMSIDTVSDRHPENILYAECKDCTLKNMDAKPIMIEVSVYHNITGPAWCKCPFNLAVGCTCVQKRYELMHVMDM
ncbi:hypothetical protein F7725_001055 [Dissostichus mawsoni]|uniref:Uncharacterized protein n=1 Tax=Dissostichus mawsoni TaxID=36200 RepID=A0A7J5ZGM8_DISMA|nr:hypothetical protein F7725_001055 [Dissostichus mawsoni]